LNSDPVLLVYLHC